MLCHIGEFVGQQYLISEVIGFESRQGQDVPPPFRVCSVVLSDPSTGPYHVTKIFTLSDYFRVEQARVSNCCCCCCCYYYYYYYY
jgi:hypothetical protein